MTIRALNVVPVAVTARELIERLRDRPSGRCLDADTSGIYMRMGDRQRTSQQTIPRDPSVN